MITTVWRVTTHLDYRNHQVGHDHGTALGRADPDRTPPRNTHHDHGTAPGYGVRGMPASGVRTGTEGTRGAAAREYGGVRGCRCAGYGGTRTEPPRVTLRRAVQAAAAASSGEPEFFGRLADAGIQVRLRHSQLHSGQVTGYAVALPGDLTRNSNLVWYGGGKLASDLTLPALRRRWADPAAADITWRLTADERDAIWQQAASAAERANRHIRALAGTDPAAAQDAAWAAADTLHAAAATLRSRVIQEAAAAYDRASRTPYRQLPARTRPGTGLRQAARLIAATGFLTADPALAQLALLPRLAALAESVAELRDAQGHAAQAAAARSAAERLRTAAVTRPPRDPRRRRTTASLARTAFPSTPRPQASDQPARPASASSARLPGRSPPPRRGRGS
jgi:hypothetical protein